MTDTTVRDRAAILAELAQVADELATTNQHSEDLYKARTRLLQEGRALPQPVTQRELAATAKVTEEAIIQVLRKAALVDAHGRGEHADKAVPKCPECKAAARHLR